MLEAVILDAIGCALQILALTLIAFFGGLTAATAYLLVAIASAVPCTVWLARNNGTLRISFQSAIYDLRNNWPLGRWILASGIVWTIAMYLYPWVLTFFHGTAATGIWAACFGVVALGNPVLLGFGNYVGPKTAIVEARSGIAAMRSYVYRSSGIFLLLLLPVAGLLLFKGGLIVSFIYGKPYAGHATTVSLLSINFLLMAVSFPYSRGLFVLRRALADLAVNIIAIGVLFTIGLQLVKVYSVNGAAISLILSTGLTLFTRIAVFEHFCSRTRISELHGGTMQSLVLTESATSST